MDITKMTLSGVIENILVNITKIHFQAVQNIFNRFALNIR